MRIAEYNLECLNNSDSRFYLNIFFLNRKEVLENIVRARVPRHRKVIRALAKRLAVNLVSDQKLVERVGADLLASIPLRLDLIGVKATASISYLQSAYICVEVDLISVDLIKMIRNGAGSVKATKIAEFLDSFELPFLKSLLESLVLKLITRKIFRSLPQVVKEKLQDKLIAEVEIIVNKSIFIILILF